MRRKINLNDVEFSPQLQEQIDQHIDDIVEFSPENCKIIVTISQLVKQNHTFEIKMQLTGPKTSIFASSQGKKLLQVLGETKRKVLSQFKSHRKQTILNRRRDKYKYAQDERYKEAA